MITITLARKPLQEGNVAANVLTHGVGALNIDGTRISGEVPSVTGQGFRDGKFGGRIGHGEATLTGIPWVPSTSGRWPANLILGHKPGCVQSGTTTTRNKGGVPKPLSTNHRTVYLSMKTKTGSKYHFDPETGLETVPAWECTPDCPVGSLDRDVGPSRFFKQIGGDK